MSERQSARDGDGGVLSRVRDRVRSVDRGWKATLVGVAVALLYAVGIV